MRCRGERGSDMGGWMDMRDGRCSTRMVDVGGCSKIRNPLFYYFVDDFYGLDKMIKLKKGCMI
jgi:hypothetical protein